MNYTVADNGPFITIGSDAGDTMIHKSNIRALKPLGAWMVKVELAKPLQHIYLNFINVNSMAFDSNVSLRNTLASWVTNTE